MVSAKKIEFFIKQGFDKDVINMFINCGVEKNLLWFLGAHKKGAIKHLNSEEIKMVNNFLEYAKGSFKISSVSYSEILESAHRHEQNEKSKLKNILYKFKNGYYVSVLESKDLDEEGQLMSNCVGTYFSRVKNGDLAILAIKQSSGKTIAHIEIRKNGLIGQNFSKANTQMNKECWDLVLDFFENNSKKIDLSNLFGESYIAVNKGAYINDISLSVPTSVRMILRDGKKEVNQLDGFEVKRFMPAFKSEEAVKINSKSDMLRWISDKKEEAIKAYDNLYHQVMVTSAENLYLSDEMKEKIFGSKKGAYSLKGDSYNISELDPRYNQGEKKLVYNDEDPMPMREELAVIDGEEPVPMREELAVIERAGMFENGQQPPANMAIPEPIVPDMPQARLGVLNERIGYDEELEYMDEDCEKKSEAIEEVVEEIEMAIFNEAVMEDVDNQENIAIAVDERGVEHEVNMNEAQEVDEMPLMEAGQMPRDFNELLHNSK